MKILIIGKYPPIQGGVSKSTYILANELAKQGHQVFVVTNAFEVEYNHRQLLLDEDLRQLAEDKIKVISTKSCANISHIPYSLAYSSKIFGAAINVIEQYGCDLIYSHYFEPYALIATQVAKLYNISVIVRPAGSDISRLIRHPFLLQSYRWLLNNASLILTSQHKAVRDKLIALGASSNKLACLPRENLSLTEWHQYKFNLNYFIKHSKTWFENYDIKNGIITSIIANNQKPFYTSTPTIGVYGKVDRTKGSFDLLEALHILAEQGLKFNFITITCGPLKVLTEYYQKIINYTQLAKKTWVLPAIAPWRIPSFIRSCDIICCLERKFPIEIHTSSTLYEVISQSRCLVASHEMISKQPFINLFIHNQNVIMNSHPQDIKGLSKILASLILSPHHRRMVGHNAGLLWQQIEQSWLKQYTLTDLISTSLI